jgi:hypothetical protein
MSYLFVFLLNGYSSAKDLSYGIGTINREKIRVESAAQTLIKNEKKSSANYKVGKFFYTEAHGAINGWIDTVIFDLKSELGTEKLDDTIKMLSPAVDKSNRFVEFVYRKKPVDAGIKNAKNAGGILTSLVEGLGFTWKEYLAGNTDKRKRILDDLEGLKVVSFEELGIHK